MNETEAGKREHRPYTVPRGMRTSRVVPRLIAAMVLALSTTVYARQIVELESPGAEAKREFEINAMLQAGSTRWNIREKESAACVGYFKTEIREAPKEEKKSRKSYRARIHINGYARLAGFDAPEITDIDLNLEFDDFFTLWKMYGRVSTPKRKIQLSSNKKRVLKAVQSMNDTTSSMEFPKALNIYAKRNQKDQYILKFPFNEELSRAGVFPEYILEKVHTSSETTCEKKNVAEGKGQINLLAFVKKILH